MASDYVSLKNNMAIFYNNYTFVRYAVIRPVCKIALGLPQSDTLTLCTLEAQEVTANDVYPPSHAIY